MFGKKKKEPKRKPKYGMFSCVAYMYRLMWQTERSLVFTGIFVVPVTVALSALALYLSPLVVSALETAGTFSYVALTIVGLLFAKLLFDLANTVITEHIANAEHLVVNAMMFFRDEKLCFRDWYLRYDTEVQKKDQRCRASCENNHTRGVHFPMDFANMIATVLNFVLLGSVISMLNPAIIVLLMIGCAINYPLGAWRQQTNWAERDALYANDKRIQYTTFGLSGDFKYAKDIRLYSMKEGMRDRIERLFSVSAGIRSKWERRGLVETMGNALVVVVRDGAAYVFLILMAVRGEVDAASFVLYFSAITSMSSLMGGVVSTVRNVIDGAMQVSDFREAMEIEGRMNHGKGIPVPMEPFSVEFQDVSYRYPEGDKQILEHVSFLIEAGEKIALVGLNGAGKTTLTLLMCGLLLPDAGEILIDGHTVFEYNRDELYGLFGLVPQDYDLLPYSIAKNIACTVTEEEIDRERVQRSIDMAGLSEKLAALPKGADTPLNRELHPDGIELSGGEAQKLLLARLLYKNPPCIILDEPTAALDPIAEDNMYRKYNEIAAHTTSVFISHRLASTRFCDRIFLLDGAAIVETGSHEELMAAGGKYRELFEIQSKYYKEGGDGDEAGE